MGVDASAKGAMAIRVPYSFQKHLSESTRCIVVTKLDRLVGPCAFLCDERDEAIEGEGRHRRVCNPHPHPGLESLSRNREHRKRTKAF